MYKAIVGAGSYVIIFPDPVDVIVKWGRGLSRTVPDEPRRLLFAIEDRFKV